LIIEDFPNHNKNNEENLKSMLDLTKKLNERLDEEKN